MTQLTDKIREAIIGNVGTIISGRIGTTDAELMQKKFAPTFDAEDLTRLPNFETVASVMINNVPSAPFSMALIPPLGQANPQLASALKRLSAAKYGKPRAEAERAIFTRLRAGDAAREEKKKAFENRLNVTGGVGATTSPSGGSSFLDEWLAKRKNIEAKKSAPAPSAAPKQPVSPQPAPPQSKPLTLDTPSFTSAHAAPTEEQLERDQLKMDDELHKVMQREEVKNADAHTSHQELKVQKTDADGNVQPDLDEIYIDVRGNLHHRGEDDVKQSAAPANAPKPPAEKP
jgi:hypothetical protein